MALNEPLARLRGWGLRYQTGERGLRRIALREVTLSRRRDIEEKGALTEAGDRAADREITYLLALEIELVLFGVE